MNNDAAHVTESFAEVDNGGKWCAIIFFVFLESFSEIKIDRDMSRMQMSPESCIRLAAPRRGALLWFQACLEIGDA